MSTKISLISSPDTDSSTSIGFNRPKKAVLNLAKKAINNVGIFESEACAYDQLNKIDKSGLLSSASLFLTPTAYKESVLYSAKPYNTQGDFTVTRATTATRVNSAGLVELVPYNLLTWSEMFSDASWVKTRTSVTANSITAPNGTLTADTLTLESTPTATIRSIQKTTNSTNLTNTASIYLKYSDRQFIQLVWSGGFSASNYVNIDVLNGTITQGVYADATITSVGDGWYRVSFTTIGTSLTPFLYVWPIDNGTDLRAANSSGTGSYYIWGAQVNEGTSALTYLPTTTRLNIPRLDYSLGSCPNLLLEPQRTNLALYSEEFDSATWVKTAVNVTTNTTISPSGVQDADKIIATSTNSSHSIFQTIGTVGNSAAISCFVKKAEYRYVNLQYGTAATRFDFDTLTFSGGTNNAYFDYGNGWYRISTVLTATVNARITILIPDNSGNISYVGDDASGTFIWGLQAESAASYPTSYIPTTTASVTRNADSISLSNVFTNGLISASGGTWFVELRNNVAIQRDSATQGIFINTGTSATIGNGITIRSLGGLVRNSIVKIISGIATTIYTTTSNTCKIAIKWNGTTADVFENGVKVVSATSFTPTAMQNLIGDGSALTLNINQMALWATPLTDDQLELLTGDSFNTYAEMASFYNYTLQ